MAQRGLKIDREKFCCSICLDLFRDPVTVPCGHSYCMSCIRGFWNEEDQRRIYSCPQCDQTFKPRPVLFKNTMLAELVEEVEITEPYVDACSLHEEVMKMFCRTDQQCICYVCSVTEHQGHNTMSASAERKERQRQLEASRQKIQEKIQHKERDIQVLHLEVEKTIQSADKAARESQKMFSELIQLMEERLLAVKQQIGLQKKAEVIRLKGLQKKLQQEITELRRKNTELETLSLQQDDIEFLQTYLSLENFCESSELPRIKIRPLQFFEDMTTAVTEARNRLMGILSEQIAPTETKMEVSPSDKEVMSRSELLMNTCEITLDPNTVNSQLSLSESKRKATLMKETQDYPSHPDRFIRWRQVLSRESLTGRCYWEVEWRRKRVTVAVAYKDISREGSMTDVAFGFNDKSWALECNSSSTYKFIHKGIKTHISGPWSSRIGVYLDHRAGLLCFYSVSETMTLLHRVHTTFTQPLYAGLWFSGYNGATAEFCELK